MRAFWLLYYKGFITVTLFWKKIVNKEVLCNLQLSHKHSGHDYAKNGGKMWIRLDFTQESSYTLYRHGTIEVVSIYSTHCSLCTIGFAIQKPICLYLTNELVFPWRMWSLTSRQTGCQDVLATQYYELSCRSLLYN